VTDREWIMATLLDLEATDGELEAAMSAATPGEIEDAFTELDLRKWLRQSRQRDVRGALAHLR
jgi:hypothetical protein